MIAAMIYQHPPRHGVESLRGCLLAPQLPFIWHPLRGPGRHVQKLEIRLETGSLEWIPKRFGFKPFSSEKTCSARLKNYMEKRRQKIGMQISRATDLGVVQYFSGSESIFKYIPDLKNKKERTKRKQLTQPCKMGPYQF